MPLLPFEIIHYIMRFNPSHREKMNIVHEEFYKKLHKNKYLNILQEIISLTDCELCTNEYCEMPIQQGSEYWGSFMNNYYPFCNERCFHAGLWGIEYDYRKYGALPN